MNSLSLRLVVLAVALATASAIPPPQGDTPFPYSPCGNKKANDKCTTCDPKDTTKKCVETDEIKACQMAPDSQQLTCSSVQTPTCDKSTGPASSREYCPAYSCKPPTRPGCTFFTTYSLKNGECCANPCNEKCEYSACGNKKMNDKCTTCDPEDTTCVETDELKTCQNNPLAKPAQLICKSKQKAEPCAPGTAGPDCVACEAGKVQPEIGGSTCIACVQGKYNARAGQKQCMACPQNFYSDTVAAVKCKSCGNGYVSNIGSVTCSKKKAEPCAPGAAGPDCVCCKASNAICLACNAKMTINKYCSKYSSTPGCPPVAPTQCSAPTPFPCTDGSCQMKQTDCKPGKCQFIL